MELLDTQIVTMVGEPPPVAVGEVEFRVWYMVLGSIATDIWGSWQLLTDGDTIPSGYDIAICPVWQNIGPEALFSHVGLAITYPDGHIETPTAYRDNDLLVPAGSSILPVFRFTPAARGNYRLRAELYGDNVLLDIQEVTMMKTLPDGEGVVDLVLLDMWSSL